jgi:hypothetical protein
MPTNKLAVHGVISLLLLSMMINIYAAAPLGKFPSIFYRISDKKQLSVS